MTTPEVRWTGPIIDAHAHPRGLHVTDDPGRPFVDEFVARARRLGVEKMSSLGEVLFRASGYSETEIRMLNDRNAELASWHPDFFVPFCFLDPMLGADFVKDEVRRCHEVHGFRAIKLEIACNVSNPATHAVFEAAEANDFPVMVHASRTDIIGNRDHQSDPADVRTALSAHSGARIIMAHLTGAGRRGVWDVRDLPNVAVDTSGMQPDSGIIEYAVEHLGVDRVVFGSDAYYRDLAVQIGQVLGADLSDAEKHAVFYDNTARILGLA